MKNTLLIIFVLLPSYIYSQKTNELRIHYDFVKNDLEQFPYATEGDVSYDTEDACTFGVQYLKSFSNNLGFGVGLNYVKADVILSVFPDGHIKYYPAEKLELISVPLYVNYTIKKYFFINSGFIVDFQTTKRNFESQSGLGVFAGLGCQYSINNFLMYLNPHFKIHSVVQFTKYDEYHWKLLELGVRIGLGYKF